MSTNRPAAVIHAETGADRWRAAALEQRAAPLHHADFYALAAEVVQTVRALEALARLLAEQVVGYDTSHRLYDDTGRVDPAERLAAASVSLGSLAGLLAEAERQANAFWSHIGHIGSIDAETAP
jgi:hypothetical protein